MLIFCFISEGIPERCEAARGKGAYPKVLIAVVRLYRCGTLKEKLSSRRLQLSQAFQSAKTWRKGAGGVYIPVRYRSVL
jgi:hypothetical protein